MASYKLDKDAVLAAIDTRDFGFFSRLSDEEKKAFAAPVILRWASAVKSDDSAELSLFLTNEAANLNFYDIWDHPELQFMLLASCGIGRKQRHDWIPMVPSRTKANILRQFFIEHFPEANDAELDTIMSRFTRDSLSQFLEDRAFDADKYLELINAYETLHGLEITVRKKQKGRTKS